MSLCNLAFTLVFASAVADAAAANPYFAIKVVDDKTERGVPLVELRTVNDLRYFTDSNGLVAFREPGLMGKEVFFYVSSHGYEYPKDGFGIRGAVLHVTAGGAAKLKIHRINIAERLYRITGGGIYADSVLVGDKVPLKEPVLNGLVLGSDTVLNAVYRKKIYWFWGDTNRPGYPLGNFQVPGAISELPLQGGLDPERGVDLAYFTDAATGFAKETMHMPGKGPTWLTSLVPLTDADGRERLYGSYVKVDPPLKVYARGLAVFNDDKEEFEHLADWDMKAPTFPSGHSFRHTDEGGDYIYFANPYPLTRVLASSEHFSRVGDYEAYTCLKEGSSLDDPVFDRDEKGLRCSWKKKTPPVGPAEHAKFIAAGKMKAKEGLLQLRDRDTEKPVFAHAGSVYWNEYRRRWVMIAVQSDGTSYLGEVWYAEADAPVGPWNYAVKVATHDKYSFYNPKQDPMLDKDGGRVIYFEGTYTHTFSGNADATPRYEYNQIMYKLDLSDPRLKLNAP